MEQVIMNLAANARDAMPRGGKLTIETENVDLDEEYTRQHVFVVAGPYVRLTVSDTGAGMDQETQARVFEPFFTTKKEGTGLGLATTYGIVKQSSGYIWVYSEPAHGATFKIYFPLVGEPPHEEVVSAWKDRAKGGEAILLVEDAESLRELTRKFLEMDGYTVLEAVTGAEAVRLAREHDGPIHLLLTDVVMPEMAGQEVAKQVSAIRPEVRVLFMSGYTENAILHHGVIDTGTLLIAKPFSREALAEKLRETLGSPRR